MISIHLYAQDMIDRFGQPRASYDDVLTQAMQASRDAKKPLFVGEFASATGWFGLESMDDVRTDFETKLKAIVDNHVPLAAIWQISSSVGYVDDALTVSREKGLGWMLDDIKAANTEIAVQLEMEARVADLLPQFETALEAATRNDIRALQTLLGDRGFKPGAVDGSYGPATKRALTACIAAGTCTRADLRFAKE